MGSSEAVFAMDSAMMVWCSTLQALSRVHGSTPHMHMYDSIKVSASVWHASNRWGAMYRLCRTHAQP